MRADPPEDPSCFLNRELSLLQFNRRVLEQALDPGTPLLERLRFLTICSTNLDEFFEIRVAGHRERAALGAVSRGADGLSSQETLVAVSDAAHALVERQYSVLNDILLPELERENVRLLKRVAWTVEQSRWIERYFEDQVLPVLTPVGLDPAHPFPKTLNKSLNFVVLVEGQDAYGRDSGIAVVHVPRALPRVINLPAEISRGRHDYVLLSSVIHAHVEAVFPGMTSTGCYQFRVTRNGDLWVDEEEVDDFLKALQVELPERKYSAAVRLEVPVETPENVAEFLLEKFELGPDELYRVAGPVNLHRLQALHAHVDRADLKYPPFVPHVPRSVERSDSLFDAISAGDILLHHPYESFAPVLELVRQAASDPQVLAIKQTLYRVGRNSPLVDSLVEAARAGKEVTVVIELRARFDEAENIEMATRLQDEGVNVVYGIVGFKTHAKLLLVVRREGERLRRYVHLGTGNYHAGTARAYTDIGFLTLREDFGEDVHQLFNQLTGLGQVVELSKVLQSPSTLQPSLLALIEQEAEHALAGRPARNIAKMNALTMPAVIQKLYRASQAGVRIDLIVRGACCLRPGVPGVSDNIRVISVVGRFLEHSRVFYFQAGGADLVYASSADWMSRNLVRRVEACFPIEDPRIKSRVLRECLEILLSDNCQAWALEADGGYRRVRSEAPALCAQQELLHGILASGEFEPQPEHRDVPRLDLEVRARERVVQEPAFGEGDAQERA